MLVAGFQLDRDWTAADPLAGATNPIEFFHNPYYYPLNNRRTEHLATLGLPLHGRRVLEVGAGIGDLSEFFLDRGCRMTITDGRADNLEVIRARYGHREDVSIARLDLDDPGELPGAHEVVFCYGVLYHLMKPGEAIKLLASLTRDILLLETVVLRDEDDRMDLVPESVTRCSQSLRGSGARPTRPWCMRVMGESFPYVYATKAQPWHGEFQRDWTVPGPMATSRAVFVASRRELVSPWLTRELPVRHLEVTP
jgi:hypothetical protein